MRIFPLKQIISTCLLRNENDVEVCCLLERLRSAKEHIEITIDAEDYYRIKDSEMKTDK